MHIWVDADACPRPVKETLFRLSQRTALSVTLVANHALPKPALKTIRTIQVSAGFDVADNYIVQHICEGDLLISSDIPLAAEVLPLGAMVLTPRGERYNQDNIQQRLDMRNFMETMRASGEQSGGPPPFNNADKARFANALDRLVAKYGMQPK
ncbi:YaiI/YqxD family protein [Agaribacterium haliotis]|uniref:YaiI/YqxD family protein n=1 Tax=Agaribacterium haliotis TaxID=2013869 RepID=UPI000BB56538|nr:YaiI/YqxD family protein [Agaribacterium haliotis]